MVCVNDVLDYFERYKAEEAGHDLKKTSADECKKKTKLVGFILNLYLCI